LYFYFSTIQVFLTAPAFTFVFISESTEAGTEASCMTPFAYEDNECAVS
jgi:hypothetical protein